MDIRCVVTGQDTSGKSVFVRDAPVAPVTLALFPGFEFPRLGGANRSFSFRPMGRRRHILATSRRRADSVLGFSPYHLRQIRKSHLLIWRRVRRTAGEIAWHGRSAGTRESGMHTTDTVDFDVVISGEVYLELDDGSEVLQSGRETA